MCNYILLCGNIITKPVKKSAIRHVHAPVLRNKSVVKKTDTCIAASKAILKHSTTSRAVALEVSRLWREFLRGILQIIFCKVQQLAVMFPGRYDKTEVLCFILALEKLCRLNARYAENIAML